MALILHPTCIPEIYFGGGNLFDDDVLAQFDGVLAFVYHMRPPGLHFAALDALRDGRIHCPHILFGADHIPFDQTSLHSLPALVCEALDKLSAQGCRNIGFHGTKGGYTATLPGALSWLTCANFTLTTSLASSGAKPHATRLSSAGKVQCRRVIT